MSRLFTRSELEGAILRHVLTLEIRGQRFRFSSSALAIDNESSAEGPSVLQVLPGLDDLRIEDRASLGDSLAPARSVSVSVSTKQATGGAWVEFARLARQHAGARGETALYREGDDWTRRQVLISGLASSFSYGGPGEPIEFTIEEEVFEDRNLWPPLPAVASEVTWPADSTYRLDENAEGARYTFVFGQPGYDPDEPFPAVPAVHVQVDGLHGANEEYDAATDAYLGHAVNPSGVLINGDDSAAVGADVRIYNISRHSGITSWYADVPATRTQDELGRTVTLASVDAVADQLIIREGDQLMAAFITDGKGGILSEKRDRAIRGAGDVLEFLLRKTSFRLDMDRAEIEALNAYLLDFYVSEQVSPWETIQKRILPLLPVTTIYTPRGLRFVRWRLDVTAADAVDHIHPQRRGGDRQSRVTFTDATAVQNRLRIDYSFRLDSGLYQRRLIYDAQPDEADSTVQANPYAAISQRAYDLREGDKIQTDIVQDPATARRILDDQIRIRGFQRRQVTYRLPQAYQHLAVGSVVLWSDDAIEEAGTKCWVTRIPREPGSGLYALETIPDALQEVL